MAGDPRLSALSLLTRVLSDGVFLDEALSRVDASERGWVHEAVAGVLRWKGRLDWIIDQLAFKKKPTGAVRKVLLLATYQLLNQPLVQPAWIVSESVALVRSREGEAASRFVNALLRKISGSLDEWRSLEFPSGAGHEEQARWASLPVWLWVRLVRERGLEWARAYAQASLERPATWVRARGAVDRAEPGPVTESWRLNEWWPVHQGDAYRSGELFVQDISSQILIRDFTEEASKRGVDPYKSTVLDLCAAPGGKSAGLAWNGWQVTATDRPSGSGATADRRFELLQQTAARICTQDSARKIRVLPRAEAVAAQSYDAVWVDAPCSGSGILRRHPEARWLKDEKILKSLIQQQQELVAEAAGLVRPGGLLMVSVCSVLGEEMIRELPGFLPVRQWLLAPQDAPYGDGFAGALWVRDTGRASVAGS